VIILSGVLVVVAIALLIAGIVAGNSGTEVVGLDGLNLIYVSIGVSIVSALFLAIGVFLRRKDLFGAPATSTTGTAARTSKRGKTAKGTRAELADAAATTRTRAGAGATATSGGTGGTSVYPTGGHSSGSDSDTAELAAMVPPAAEVPATAVVHVVPGRRRYHIDSCRQLAGRSKEELTFAEAREEGFSPCTACMPDTALAARAVAGGLETAAEPDSESAADDDARFDDAASEDARGAVGRSEWSAASGSLSSVTPVQRQALDDLTEADDEPTRPATDSFGGRPHDEAAGDDDPAYGGRSATDSGAAAAVVADDRTADDGTADDAADETVETVADDDPPAPQAFDAAASTAEHDAPDTAVADAADTEIADARDGRADAGTDDQGDATSAAEVPPQATRPTPAATADTGEAAAGGDGTLVRILSGTKRYHRPDCALIEDIGDDADDLESLSRAEAKARGCTPCLVCQPDKEPAARD
jgi:methylphosphotriester-DNA--protein-cysteine methyltransferase